MGLDWSPNDGEEVVLTARLGFSTQAEAEHWQGQLKRLLDLYVEELQSSLAKDIDGAGTIDAARALLSILRGARLQIREASDGRQLCVELQGPLETLPIVKDSLKPSAP
jgi:hypothetical protein